MSDDLLRYLSSEGAKQALRKYGRDMHAVYLSIKAGTPLTRAQVAALITGSNR